MVDEIPEDGEIILEEEFLDLIETAFLAEQLDSEQMEMAWCLVLENRTKLCC